MVGRAAMVVAAMVEEAMAAVAEVLLEAGAVVAMVAEVAGVVAMVAEVVGVVALDEAGADLHAGDAELKMCVAIRLFCRPCVRP